MTKPTPAQIKAWRGVVEQAMSCIRGETPEDVSFGEAEDDTFSKLREVDAEMSVALTAAAGVGRQLTNARPTTPPNNVAGIEWFAAAGVGPKDAIEWQAWAMEVEARTIEDCAQVVEAHPETTCIAELAAAIRAKKVKP